MEDSYVTGELEDELEDVEWHELLESSPRWIRPRVAGGLPSVDKPDKECLKALGRGVSGRIVVVVVTRVRSTCRGIRCGPLCLLLVLFARLKWMRTLPWKVRWRRELFGQHHNYALLEQTTAPSIPTLV